ncbi:MAG: hypothetical protein H7832_01300 [Magnetococcus sp. DMHC-6]
MASDRVGSCYHCGEVLYSDNYGRSDDCPKCLKETRVCLNCIFYDVDYYNQCQENQADRVVEKDEANFCDYFRPTDNPGIKHIVLKEDPFAAAKALFGK